MAAKLSEQLEGAGTLERFVRFTAPNGKVDFVLKLLVFLFICGALNHLRDVISNGFDGRNTFLNNTKDATFTALPMCSFALLLIGHLNKLQKQLYLQATRDTLTGLPNRRRFLAATPEILHDGTALMIIDVDHFKAVNDHFGHDVGDACLIEVAAHLKETIGADGIVARIGGEEFAVYFDNIAGVDVEALATEMARGVNFDTGRGVVQRVTMSVGITMGEAGVARTTALNRADHAAFQAKAEGRARWVMHKSSPARDMVPDRFIPGAA